jgi:hypothetical protein
VGPTDHSARLTGGVGSTFLGSSESVQIYWVIVKGCHVRGLPIGSIRVVYVDWSRKHICRVYQVSPVGCTSIRITTTLGYE